MAAAKSKQTGDSTEAEGPSVESPAMLEVIPEADPPPRPKTKTKATRPPLRAGGYIDQHDGRGWILED